MATRRSKGTVFHYFVIKVMTKDAVSAERAMALDLRTLAHVEPDRTGVVPRGSTSRSIAQRAVAFDSSRLSWVEPDRTGIVPRKGAGHLAAERKVQLAVALGYRPDVGRSEELGMTFQVKDFDTGYTAKEVQGWLNGEGKAWAANGFCILFHAAVDVVSGNLKPRAVAKKAKPTTPAKKPAKKSAARKKKPARKS